MTLQTENLTVSFREVRYRFFIYRYRPDRQQVLVEVVVTGKTGRWGLGASLSVWRCSCLWIGFFRGVRNDFDRLGYLLGDAAR